MQVVIDQLWGIPEYTEEYKPGGLQQIQRMQG